MNYLYRMTHIDNIPHILRHGITHRSSANANPDYVPIGDSEIIMRRLNKTVETVGGEKFVPGDYIPFYFYARMPMLYNIQHGYHVRRIAPEDIVYIIVDLSMLLANRNLNFYFSDGHAISSRTQFYGKDRINDIDVILNIEAIKTNDWGGDSIIKDQKQAEFLVESDIPVEMIVTLCCYNSSVRQKLIDMGVDCPVIVNREAYY